MADRSTAAAAVPVVVAVTAFGVSYGVLAAAAGLTTVDALALSLLVFAGSSQFAFVSLVAAGTSPVAAALSAALLNARYAATGAVAARSLPGGRLRRFLAAQLVVDESFVLGVAAGTPDRPHARTMLVTGAALWIGWAAGTLVGSALGPVVGDPRTLGLDAAFPALFIALLWPLLRGKPAAARAAVAGGAVALVVQALASASPGIALAGAAVAGCVAYGGGDPAGQGRS